jgi:hypothetical protein
MKRRAWKWLLGIVAAVAMALGGLLWSAHSRATAAFQRHDARVKEAISSLRARPIVRASLSEDTQPGDGLPSFLSVLKEFETIPDVDLDVLPAFTGDHDQQLDRAKLDEMFEKYGALIERLRQSDRNRELVPAYRYEDGWAVDFPMGTTAIRAARFLAERAEHLDHRGRDAAALESILLGMSVAHDTGRGGGVTQFLNQIICESTGSYRMKLMLENHSFQAPDLKTFAEKLDHLWTRRPKLADALRVDGILDRRSLINIEFMGSDAPAVLYEDRAVLRGRSWRYLFSRRLASAGALDELEQRSHEDVRLASLPPTLQAEALADVATRQGVRENPVVGTLAAAMEAICRSDFSHQMEWMLMRTAVAIAWFEAEHGKSPGSLADLVPKYLPGIPSCIRTGKPLEYRDGKVWWVGRDGIDEGGKPGLNNDVLDDKGDVVWTVKRK